MAAMLYIYVCFYSMGWGPLPTVYVSEIFPTHTRHYGLAIASGTQWLFSTSMLTLSEYVPSLICMTNFVVSKVTPTLVADLGYQIFFMFGAINIGGMTTFSLPLPETKGRSLEEMDIIFGTVSLEAREAFIARQQRELRWNRGIRGQEEGAQPLRA